MLLLHFLLAVESDASHTLAVKNVVFFVNIVRIQEIAIVSFESLIATLRQHLLVEVRRLNAGDCKEAFQGLPVIVFKLLNGIW